METKEKEIIERILLKNGSININYDKVIKGLPAKLVGGLSDIARKESEQRGISYGQSLFTYEKKII